MASEPTRAGLGGSLTAVRLHIHATVVGTQAFASRPGSLAATTASVGRATKPALLPTERLVPVWSPKRHRLLRAA